MTRTFDTSLYSFLNRKLKDIPLSPNLNYAPQLLLYIARGALERRGSSLSDDLEIGKPIGVRI